MMIPPGLRFFAPNGNIYPGGPSTWNIFDWDQRRLVSVTMDEELDSEDPAVEYLARHIDDLAPDVYAIHVGPNGELVSASNDPKDDETRCAWRPPLEAMDLPRGTSIVSRTDLVEVDRLSPTVDTVLRPGSSAPTQKLVFKYFILHQQIDYIWHEIGLWARLPRHPNLVPFDSVVVDELEGRLVGFTTPFIPGGTLEENKSRPFRLSWLRQLIQLVDYLNLRLGIAHQDIAPRNLLVDDATDSILLFDFNFAARIGIGAYSEPRNDVKGVLFTVYEIITRDQEPRSIRHEEQDVDRLQALSWAKHPDVVLDRPVSEFRDVLDRWREVRRSGKQMTAYTDAPEFLDWPPLPTPPPTEMEMMMGTDKVKELVTLYDWKRTKMRKEGKPVLDWQRLPQRGEEVAVVGLTSHASRRGESTKPPSSSSS